MRVISLHDNVQNPQTMTLNTQWWELGIYCFLYLKASINWTTFKSWSESKTNSESKSLTKSSKNSKISTMPSSTSPGPSGLPDLHNFNSFLPSFIDFMLSHTFCSQYWPNLVSQDQSPWIYWLNWWKFSYLRILKKMHLKSKCENLYL